MLTTVARDGENERNVPKTFCKAQPRQLKLERKEAEKCEAEKKNPKTAALNRERRAELLVVLLLSETKQWIGLLSVPVQS